MICFYNNTFAHKIRKYPQRRQSGRNVLVQNVLHINTFDKVGGAAVIANSLCRALLNKGINSKMLVSQSVSSDDYVEPLKIRKYFGHGLFNYLKKYNDWNDLLNISSLFSIRQHALFQQSEIVHVHNIHGGYFNPVILPELTSLKPFVWTLHDTQELSFPCDNFESCEKVKDNCINCEDINKDLFSTKDYFIWMKKNEIFNSSTFTIVCPSLWLKKRVETSYLKDHKIEIIYNGIDTAIFNKNSAVRRDELELPEDKFILLFAAHGGLNNPWKGGEFIRRIYNKLKHVDDFYFVCVGGEETRLVEKNFKEVSYVKNKSDMAQYYALSDLFVYPSIKDVFGLVVAESLSCGTPVITFNTGGIPEIVEHMNTGYLAQHGDIDDLIQGILYFHKNHELRKEIESSGPLMIQKKFSIDRMADNYIDLYNRVIQENA